METCAFTKQIAHRYDLASNLVLNMKMNFDTGAALTDVLSSIADNKINRIDELLPWRYAESS
ncbi:MAG: hypothetical protein ACI9XZ_004747 [Alphaproteobacteria bacterium]|jgi:hypothetical protein